MSSSPRERPWTQCEAVVLTSPEMAIAKELPASFSGLHSHPRPHRENPSYPETNHIPKHTTLYNPRADFFSTMERPHVYGVELSRLRNLSTSPQPPRKIHFRLESDTLPVRDSYLDLYIPEFHQYRSHNGRQVRHLDITSTWRSLSIAHAEELKFWEEMAAAVLEYTISNHLIDLIDCMDDCNIGMPPCFLVLTVVLLFRSRLTASSLNRPVSW